MDEMMTIPSRRMTLKAALLNVGFTAKDLVASKIDRQHCKAVCRQKREVTFNYSSDCRLRLISRHQQNCQMLQ